MKRPTFDHCLGRTPPIHIDEGTRSQNTRFNPEGHIPNHDPELARHAQPARLQDLVQLLRSGDHSSVRHVHWVPQHWNGAAQQG